MMALVWKGLMALAWQALMALARPCLVYECHSMARVAQKMVVGLRVVWDLLLCHSGELKFHPRPSKAEKSFPLWEQLRKVRRWEQSKDVS